MCYTLSIYLTFLDGCINVSHQIGKVFSHYFFQYFSTPFSFFLSFRYSPFVNVGVYNGVSHLMGVSHFSEAIFYSVLQIG